MYARRIIFTLVLALVAAAPARASVTTTMTAGFTSSTDGFASSVSYGSACSPPTTCPVAQADHQASGGASGGHLRSRLTTGIGVATDASVLWRSSNFTVGAMDSSVGSLKVRTDAGTLLDGANQLRLRGRLVDVAPGGASTLVSDIALQNSSTFTTIAVPLPAGALLTGHTYRFEVTVTLTTEPQASPATATVALDDLSLSLVVLQPPTGLTATAATANGVTVSGVANPNNVPTSVRVQYGPTAAYGATSPAVPLSGSGAKAYAIPLAGLTPGATYHYRTVAQSADGTATTADASFVVPFVPDNGAASVAGPLNERARTVSYDVVAGATAVHLELTGAGGAVVATVPDPDMDGTLPLTLPDVDATYGVRVVRDGAGGGTSTSATVPVLLDRVAPSVAGLALTVAPPLSSFGARAVTFVRPADAAAAEVEVLDAGGTPMGSGVAPAGGAATVQLSAGDGDYRVRVTVRDAAGNAASTTSGVVTLDTTPPATGAAPTVTGDPRSRTRTITFTRAPDTDTAAVELLTAGTVIATEPAPANSATLTFPDSDGDYQIRVRQTDTAANGALTSSATTTLDRVAPDPGPAPTITGNPRARARTVTFTRAPDAAQVEVEVEGGDSVSVAGGSSATIALPAVDGTYLVRVRQTDAAGNAAVSAAGVVVLDRTVPVQPGPEETPAVPAPEPTPPDAAAPTLPDPGRFGPLLADCLGAASGIALTDVQVLGRRVKVTGLHAFAPGTPIAIVDSKRRTVARTTAGADGHFAATAPLPSAAERKTIRYQAKVGTVASAQLKLVRVTSLRKVTVSRSVATITGEVVLGKRLPKFTVRGGRGPTACKGAGKDLTLAAAAKLDPRTGRFTVKAKLPANTTGRVAVRVRVTGAVNSASLYFIV